MVLTVDVKEIAAKAQALKKKGLKPREIAQELHLALDTVTHLLEYGAEGLPPSDVKIGWRSLGIFGSRIGAMAEILADVVVEEIEKAKKSVDVVLGVAINGIPFATMVADILEVELAVYRPHEEGEREGAFSSNYASVEGKNVVIIDDVLSTGATIHGAITDVKAAKGTPVLAVVIVNKSSGNEVDGVKLRSIIRARSIGGTILGGGPIKSYPYG